MRVVDRQNLAVEISIQVKEKKIICWPYNLAVKKSYLSPHDFSLAWPVEERKREEGPNKEEGKKALGPPLRL